MGGTVKALNPKALDNATTAALYCANIGALEDAKLRIDADALRSYIPRANAKGFETQRIVRDAVVAEIRRRFIGTHTTALRIGV
jgi:hypothetical protein